MTIASQSRTAGPFTGTGLFVSYPFAFKVFTTSDLLIQQTDTNGNVATWTLGANYTVILNLDQSVSPGGTITPLVALPTGYVLNVTSAVTLTQPASLTNAGGFFAKTIEDALDRLTILIQQALGTIAGALRVPEITGTAALPPAAARANLLLSFDTNGNPIVVAPVAGTATALATNLANASNGFGADIVGGTGRVVNTIAALKALVKTGVGRAFVLGYYAAGDGGGGQYYYDSSDTTSTDNGGSILVASDGGRWKLVNFGVVSVKQFGAMGNSNGTTGNGNDDLAACQATLDYAATIFGCTVNFPKSSGAYRISAGLKQSSFTTILGHAVDRYPYNSTAGATYLYADFASATQWVIEPKTLSGGNPVAYNAYLTAFPSGPTYNCAVRNLQIRANTSATPVYGGIRMHGCPGSVVDNVSVVNTGLGVFVNECYGGSYQGHTITYYYGFIGWQEVNANDINFYSTILNPATKVVPAGYIPPFLSALSASLTTTYNLSTNAHYNRCWGMVLGADSTTNSVSNVVSFTHEGFSGGVLQLGSTGTAWQRFYMEGAANQVDYACVAAKSSFSASSFHAFLSATGTLLDIGSNCFADVAATGLITYSTFGTIYFSTTTTFILRGIVASALSGVPVQYNLIFRDDPGLWQNPALVNSWANSSMASGYRKNGQTGNTELQGTITTGTVNTVAFTLPVGYRPAQNKYFAVNSNNGATLSSVLINTSGQVIPVTGLPSWGITLDGIQFRAEA